MCTRAQHRSVRLQVANAWLQDDAVTLLTWPLHTQVMWQLMWRSGSEAAQHIARTWPPGSSMASSSAAASHGKRADSKAQALLVRNRLVDRSGDVAGAQGVRGGGVCRGDGAAAAAMAAQVPGVLPPWLAARRRHGVMPEGSSFWEVCVLGVRHRSSL